MNRPMSPESRALAIIESIYNDADVDEACSECEHYECTVDREPYGDQMVNRESWECTVGDDKDCPYVREVLELALGVVEEKAKPKGKTK